MLQEPLPSIPSIVLYDFSIHTQADGPSTHSDAHQQYSDGDLDPIIIDDPATYDYTNSSAYDYSELSAYNHADQSGSDISGQLPLSSGVPSEVSSAVTSDSDLPPPPPSLPSKSLKPVQQTGLLNFFSVVPGHEAHATWGKNKRKNRERDEEERAEIRRDEEKRKQEKVLVRRKNNNLAQQKHRKRIHDQEIKNGIRDEDGKKFQVS